jgi:hypothetical protein
VKKIAQKPVEQLLKGIGDAQQFGGLKEAKFQEFFARGRMAQVSFSVDFDKLKGARLMVLGEVKGDTFEMQDLQFSKSAKGG